MHAADIWEDARTLGIEDTTGAEAKSGCISASPRKRYSRLEVESGIANDSRARTMITRLNRVSLSFAQLAILDVSCEPLLCATCDPRWLPSLGGRPLAATNQ